MYFTGQIFAQGSADVLPTKMDWSNEDIIQIVSFTTECGV